MIYVENYAELRALDSSTLSDNQPIHVTGGHVFGVFIVKTGNVIDNGGTILNFSDSSNKYCERLVADVINPAWWRDGSTTDKNAFIQAIANAHGREIGFSGTYVFGGNPDVSIPSNITIRGMDKNSTIQFTGISCFDIEGDITHYPTSFSFIRNIKFIGVTFENTDTFNITPSTAINAKCFEDLLIEDCHAKECHLINCEIKHDTIDRKGVNPLGTVGIDNDAAMNKRLKVVNCSSYVSVQQTSGEYSILPNFVVDAYVAGNTIDGAGIAANAVNAQETVGGDFTYYRMHKEHKYIGNTIKRSRVGVFVGLGDRCSIQGNTVKDAFDVGVDFESCKNCVAIGNTFYNCKNGAIATFFLNHGNIFEGNSVIVNKTSDSEDFDNIALVGGSNYTYNENSELTSLLIQGNSFEYYDESLSETHKQLRINVVPQNTLVTFKNNFCRNVVLRTSDVGATVKCNIIGNEFYFETPPVDPVIFCRPLGSLKLMDGQLGWLIEGNEILLTGGSPSGTVAIETVFDESNTHRQFDVHVTNNKISEFETAFKISGNLVRPNEAGVIYRDNYTDGAFLNAHNVLGPSIFWGYNYDKEGRPYNSNNEVQDYGYMRESCHYGIKNSTPGEYSERILTKKGFNNTNGIRANNTDYLQGDRVSPVADGSKVWLCLTGGTSAGAEPAANSGDFVDGTVTWREFDNVSIKGRNLVDS